MQGAGPLEITRLGQWSEDKLERLLSEASSIPDTGALIEHVSRRFLGTPYMEETLVGSASTPERLVVDLEGVDCFTFLDQVEAMRRASSFREFVRKLREVRYKEGVVGFTARNHFFTDWAYVNPSVRDVTRIAGGGFTRTVTRRLNLKEDGDLHVAGVEPFDRSIDYIPRGSIRYILDALRTGDYIGVFADAPGLDVSHVGILIGSVDGWLLRHASSAAATRRVLDEPFLEYIDSRPGVIVLRPLP